MLIRLLATISKVVSLLTLCVIWAEGRVAGLSEEGDVDAADVDLVLQLAGSALLLVVSVDLV